MRFIDEIRFTDPVNLAECINLIYDTLKRDFPNDPKCLRLLAERELDIHSSKPNSEKKAFLVYENALEVKEMAILIVNQL